MGMKDDVADYDPAFAEVMKPNPLDGMLNGFIQWVSKTKMGSPAPSAKAVAIAQKDWARIYSAAKLDGSPTTPEEWTRTPAWLLLPFATTAPGGRVKTREKRIENLARVFPDIEQHIIEGLADFDAVLFVQQTDTPQLPLPTDAVAEMCLMMLERWHNKPGAYAPQAQEWKREFLSHLREVAKGGRQ